MTEPLDAALSRLVQGCNSPGELTARVTPSFGVGALGRARTIAYELKGRDWLYPEDRASQTEAGDSRGWVYVLTNRAMPGLVKVGFSTKHPALRAQQLEGTGVPHPFDVAFHVSVADPRAVERLAHLHLDGYRESKEFFRVDVDEAIRLVAAAAASSAAGPREDDGVCAGGGAE